MLTDWRFALTAAIFCSAVLFTCIETNAQSVPKDAAARIEIHPIPTLTLSDQQFLTGDSSNARPATVAGELRKRTGVCQIVRRRTSCQARKCQ